MPDETALLLALLEFEARWAQNAEARSDGGAPDRYDGISAVDREPTGCAVPPSRPAPGGRRRLDSLAFIVK